MLVVTEKYTSKKKNPEKMAKSIISINKLNTFKVTILTYVPISLFLKQKPFYLFDTEFIWMIDLTRIIPFHARETIL